MNAGDLVTIFIDPVAQRKVEGKAVLVKRIDATDKRAEIYAKANHLECWIVQFEGDEGPVERFVKSN